MKLYFVYTNGSNINVRLRRIFMEDKQLFPENLSVGSTTFNIDHIQYIENLQYFICICIYLTMQNVIYKD